MNREERHVNNGMAALRLLSRVLGIPRHRNDITEGEGNPEHMEKQFH